jgi:5-methylcytosine-specific restriction endonuclease McrA
MPKKPSVSPKQILALLESQQYRCALSGRELSPETASLDHVIPLSRGGVHDISNVQVLDYRVNAAKGTMTVEEFVQMCRDVALHAERAGLPAAFDSVPPPPGG